LIVAVYVISVKKHEPETKVNSGTTNELPLVPLFYVTGLKTLEVIIISSIDEAHEYTVN
jgi:hypothetical protein